MTRTNADPTDGREPNRPDPTDPEATEWDVPIDGAPPGRGHLVADAISGSGALMVHEQGTDPSPGDDSGAPHIIVGRGETAGLEASR